MVCVLDIADHWFFKAVGIQKDEIEKRSFLKLSFVSKGLEGIHLGNILANYHELWEMYNDDDHGFAYAEEWSWNIHHIHRPTGRAR
jgi:hypothetical protein